MKTKKKKKIKSTKTKKQNKKSEKVDPNIEKVYETTITFTCPVRGLVTQIVKVKRYKTKEIKTNDVVKSVENDILSQVEDLDSSLMDE